MAQFSVELNHANIGAFLKGSEVESALLSIASSRSPGADYEIDSRVGKNRVWVRITAATEEAMQDNLDNNTLLKVISG